MSFRDEALGMMRRLGEAAGRAMFDSPLVRAAEEELSRKLVATDCEGCRLHIYSGYLYSACGKHQGDCDCTWCLDRRRKGQPT